MRRAVGRAPRPECDGSAIVGGRARASPSGTAAIIRVEVHKSPVPDQKTQWFVVVGARRSIGERQSLGLARMHVASKDYPVCGALLFVTHAPQELCAFLLALRQGFTP